MAENVTLNNVSTFVNDATAVSVVNGNSATITTAFVDVLSRSGTSPNQMNANLDMNSNRIINLPTPIATSEPVTLSYFQAHIGSGGGGGTPGGVNTQLQYNNSGAFGGANLYYSGGNLGVGTETNPQIPFVFSQNSVTGINFSSFSLTNFTGPWMAGAAGAVAVGWNTLAVAGPAVNNLLRFDNTLSSPSNLGSGELIGALSFGGWGAGALQASRATIVATTTEAWTTTFGASLQFNTVPTGGAKAQAMLLKGGVIVGTATTDPGSGNLYVSGSAGINCIPGVPLDINANAFGTGSTAENPIGPIRLTLADTTAGGYAVQTFGANPVNVFTRADGTAASPTAVGANETIGALSMQPWNGSAYATLAQVRAQSSEAHTVSAGGTQIDFLTTPKTTRTLTLTARFNGSGGVAIGSSGATIDPGNGCLLLSPQTFASLSAAGSTTKGRIACVTDSTTATWGATITGSGTNVVLAFDDGTNWTVVGK
jgi:hypothetical protein